jgi:hypothetical protein
VDSLTCRYILPHKSPIMLGLNEIL